MIAAEPSPPWAPLLALPKVRCFIDTNVLVYADSTDEPRKQRIAIDLLRHLLFEILDRLDRFHVLNVGMQLADLVFGLRPQTRLTSF